MKRLLFGLLLIGATAQAQTTVTITGDGTATVVSVGTQGPTGATGATGPAWTGGTITSPLLAPTYDNCTTPPFSFTADTTTGLCSSTSGVVHLRSSGVNVFSVSPTAITSTVQILAPNGTAGAPGLSFSAQPGLGFYRTGTDEIAIAVNKYFGIAPLSNYGLELFTGGISLGTLAKVVFTTGNQMAATDTTLGYDASHVVAFKPGTSTNDTLIRKYGANGSYWEYGSVSELVTIAAAPTSDSSANLLPANAIIEAISIRVTVAIPTAATFTVGDAATPERFATGVSVDINTTAIGTLHRNPTVADAAGPVQTTAAVIRITPNLQPVNANGRVRITVYYSLFVPGSS